MRQEKFLESEGKKRGARLKTITILGAGTMGKGIALSFARAGYQVHLFDSVDTARQAALPSIEADLKLMAEMKVFPEKTILMSMRNITIYDDMEQAALDADFLIEVVPENLELKKEIFGKLDLICKPSCIFASNTSSLKLGDMMMDLSTERKKRTMICHFYNPAHLMPIVELSFYGNMPEEIFKDVYDMFYDIGKQPVKVKKDVPGLIANRIQNAMAREIYSLIEKEVADPEEIDKAIKFGPCFRYATTGQREITDMGGIDIWTTVADILWGDLEARTDASNILRNKVKEGKLGVKTGEGFFRYDTEEKKKDVVREFQKRLMVQLLASENYK